jgi:hypothetical protein
LNSATAAANCASGVDLSTPEGAFPIAPVFDETAWDETDGADTARAGFDAGVTSSDAAETGVLPAE